MHYDRTDLLVLDDDPDLIALIPSFLAPVCRVRVANDVSEAHRELRRCRPECLLCDYWLGETTSIDFLKLVAGQCSLTRRVLKSGCSLKEIQPLLDEQLVHCFVNKPLDYEATVRCIRGPRCSPKIVEVRR
jgi:DNA-binding NtrC family response regulator